MNPATNIKDFDLGFIGHKATELQHLFSEYTIKENEYGYFLEFVNYSELVNNQGVYVLTNCFETEQDFKDRLFLKLLSKL